MSTDSRGAPAEAADSIPGQPAGTERHPSNTNTLLRAVVGMAAVGAVALMVSASVELLDILAALGLSPFGNVSLTDQAKVSLALYAVFAMLGALLASVSVYLVRHGLPRYSAASGGAAALLAVATVTVPGFQGYSVALAAQLSGLIATVLMAGATVSALRLPTRLAQPRIAVALEVAFIAVFSALTAVLTATTGQLFPSPTGGYTHVGDTVIYVASLLLGPKVGALTGILGALAADFYVGYPRWFVSVPAHGSQGLIAGLGRGRALPVQLALCAVGGFTMATTYLYVNIFIKGMAPALVSYARDLFGQTLVSLILTAFVMPPLKRLTPRLRAIQTLRTEPAPRV